MSVRHASTETPTMLARSRRVDLCGSSVETPLLVPAISSKAVGPIETEVSRNRTEQLPASTIHTSTFVGGIDEAVLVSAYDIHHGLLTDVAAFRAGFAHSIYAIPQTLFIDSGWYEKNVCPASSPWYHEVGGALPFDKEDYETLVDAFDPDLQAVLVSWDNSGPYASQIEAAQTFFATRTRFGSSLLLKPEPKRRFHDFGGLSGTVASRLRHFRVVGVTEKELGNTILARLVALASFRRLLDEADVATPIHVFGGLDPLLTPLYFAAGAEIFDSLSWLRYAFRDGMALHRECAPLLNRHYEKRFSAAIAQVQLENLDAIAELGRELKVFFHNGGDWAKLRRGTELKPAYEALEAVVGRSHGR